MDEYHLEDADDAPILQAMRSAFAARKGSVAGPEGRAAYDDMRAATPDAAGVALEPGNAGGLSGWWCRPPGAAQGSKLLFLHGGGYMLGSAGGYRNFASQIAASANADTFAVDYRLAPEHPFPAAISDALSAYRGLVEGGANAIALVGDSAGGGLALALLSIIAQDMRLAPDRVCGAAVMSPWTDLALSGRSMTDRASADPIFTRDALSGLAAAYLQGQDPDDPRASPLNARLTGLPPIRIDVGEDEVLLDDARRYAAAARRAGAAVTLAIWQGMPHVFQTNLGRLTGAARSVEAIGGFLAERLASGALRPDPLA